MTTNLGTAEGRIKINVSDVVSSMQQAGKSIQSFQSGAALAMVGVGAVSYTHLTLPTNREV